MEHNRFRPKLQSLERRETPSGNVDVNPPAHVPPEQIIIEPEIKIIIVPPSN